MTDIQQAREWADQQRAARKALEGGIMSDCECPYLPEKYHYVHYGITEPGSMQEYNPDCPVHGGHR